MIRAMKKKAVETAKLHAMDKAFDGQENRLEAMYGKKKGKTAKERRDDYQASRNLMAEDARRIRKDRTACDNHLADLRREYCTPHVRAWSQNRS